MGNFEKTAHQRAGRVIRVVDANENPLAGKKTPLHSDKPCVFIWLRSL